MRALSSHQSSQVIHRESHLHGLQMKPQRTRRNIARGNTACKTLSGQQASQLPPMFSVLGEEHEAYLSFQQVVEE
eukprot:CAMPEP_0206145044 /NCGR_PEP_ID=MMETSP1473-20131121/26194_1 /ASSEMBLY_ACC=CAM_ASM_001109 /TAXON_ID=1461547 /ORGANISM="Stichococcus sp, Strain RCC1054" /LENGTH=74 /DNA_ID=CAMNT_0053541099 /DNA_START=152 /DNA_END=373 /DNA_ORIENTATION=+